MGKVSDRHGTDSGSKEPATSPAMGDLIRRLATFPHGLEFLETATLECAAITFGVCPDVISQAREHLAAPERRAWFLDQVQQAQRQPPIPWHAPRPQLASPAPGPRSLAGLLRAADAHPYGLSFLLESPPETVAVIFHVHPQRVLLARALFARWDTQRKAKSKPANPSHTSRGPHC